jgi:hypothetical protein
MFDSHFITLGNRGGDYDVAEKNRSQLINAAVAQECAQPDFRA